MRRTAASATPGHACCLPEGCPAISPRARRCQGALRLQRGCPRGAPGETSLFLLPSGDLRSPHLQLCPPTAAHVLQPGQLLDTHPNPTTPADHTMTGFPDTVLQLFPLSLVQPEAITTGSQGIWTCEWVPSLYFLHHQDPN